MTFERKSWDDLSDAYRSRLESQGQTRQRHDAGLPPPKAGDREPQRDSDGPTAAGGPSEPHDVPPRIADTSGSSDLAKPIKQLLGVVGLAIYKADKFDGLVVMENGAKLADSLVEASESSPQLRRMLELLSVGGGYAPLAWASAGIAVPIMVRHGLLPDSALAVVGGLPPAAEAELRKIRAAQADPEPEPEPAPEPTSADGLRLTGDPLVTDVGDRVAS